MSGIEKFEKWPKDHDPSLIDLLVTKKTQIVIQNVTLD